MKSIVAVIFAVFLLPLLWASPAVCQGTERERLAILSFAVDSLSPAQAAQLRQNYVDALNQTKRFNILPFVAMESILDDAGMRKTDDCTTRPCLAQLGKILAVDKVLSVRVAQTVEGFSLQIQLVEASDASLDYEVKSDYHGTFKELASVEMPNQGRTLGTTKFGKGVRWYVIAGAAVVGLGIIYWLYTTFTSVNTSQSQSSGPISSPQ